MFRLLFGLSVVIAAGATYLAVTDTSPSAAGQPGLFWLLIANLVLIAGVATVLGVRVYSLVRENRETNGGARLRLRADADLTGLGPQATVLATALQRYGAIVADTTVTRWHLGGVPDDRWDEDDLATLRALRPESFEWVDVASWSPREGSLAVAP